MTGKSVWVGKVRAVWEDRSWGRLPSNLSFRKSSLVSEPQLACSHHGCSGNTPSVAGINCVIEVNGLVLIVLVSRSLVFFHVSCISHNILVHREGEPSVPESLYSRGI